MEKERNGQNSNAERNFEKRATCIPKTLIFPMRSETLNGYWIGWQQQNVSLITFKKNFNATSIRADSGGIENSLLNPNSPEATQMKLNFATR